MEETIQLCEIYNYIDSPSNDYRANLFDESLMRINVVAERDNIELSYMDNELLEICNQDTTTFHNAKGTSIYNGKCRIPKFANFMLIGMKFIGISDCCDVDVDIMANEYKLTTLQSKYNDKSNSHQCIFIDTPLALYYAMFVAFDVKINRLYDSVIFSYVSPHITPTCFNPVFPWIDGIYIRGGTYIIDELKMNLEKTKRPLVQTMIDIIKKKMINIETRFEKSLLSEMCGTYIQKK